VSIVNLSQIERGINRLIAAFNKMGIIPRLRRGTDKDPFIAQVIIPEDEWNKFLAKHFDENILKYISIRIEFQRLIFEIKKP